MDPLCHTLAGAALAESPVAFRGGRRLPLATATLLIGSNLPDVDVLSYVHGPDYALSFRRGWTHGVLAMALLPLLLAAAVLAWDRWVRRRRRPELPPAGPRAVLGLAYLSVLSHPLLDWLNTYGVRLLAPFDWSWFYGDTLFIVDPWLWLTLGGGVLLARRPGRLGLVGWTVLGLLASLPVMASPATEGLWGARLLWLAGIAGIVALHRHWRRPVGRPAGTRVATAALAVATAYVAAMGVSSLAARSEVLERLDGRGLAVEEPRLDLMVGPVPLDPFDRQVVARRPGEVLTGRFSWLPAPRLKLDPEPFALPPPTDAVREALTAPQAAGLTGWVRFPVFEVEHAAEGTTVWVLDARYTRRRTTGFGGTAVRIGGD